MRDGLFGADPPVLRVIDHVPPRPAHVRSQVLHRAADDALGEDVEREADDFTAAAIAECLSHQISVSLCQHIQ